ncbi:Membrane protein involved in the export of O-antigen and teichoic acid [Mariprofundus aestuarium]|uniref:Membrane protein involved in the export of O-antigen and teichoic acid n=1 Tax=Mariprofundus aestuarium TaxID=1921086 RepID=A0A2K8L363_MARES|nr:oligosaccharide flippase family protein [Mariprofundus aestuarium]ATX80281.1 Membrane protein involved in the export of O-antigen and teichoic acid [Mariprofundus aestuarium]
MRRSLLGDATLAFVLKLSGTIVLFSLSIYISREMGADAFGMFSLFLSILLPLSVLARMGLDNNLLRLVSRLLVHKPKAEVSVLYKQSFKAVLYCSAGISLLILLVDVVSSRLSINAKATDLFPWLAIALPFHALLMLNAYYLRGKHWVVRSSLYENVLVFLFTLVFLLTFQKLITEHLSTSALLFGIILTSLVSFFAINKSLNDGSELIDELPDIKERFKEALPMMGTSLATIAFVTLDVFLLSFFVDFSELGIYAAAAKLVGFVGFPLMAIIAMAGPRLSEADAKGDVLLLKKVYRDTSRLVVWSGVPIFIVLLFVPDLLLGFFGEGFSKATTVVYILLAGQAFNLAMGPIGYLLWMSGRALELQKATLVSLVVLVLLSLLLMPLMGMEGAAIAVSSALMVKGVGCWWLVRKWLGFDPMYIPGKRSSDVSD